MYYANTLPTQVADNVAASTGIIDSSNQEGIFKMHYPGRWWRYMIFLVIFTIIAIVWSVFSIIDSHKCSKYEDQLNGTSTEDEEWQNLNPDIVTTCENKSYVWLPIVMWLIPIIIFMFFYFYVLKTHRCLKKAGTNAKAEQKCMLDYNTRHAIGGTIGDIGAAAILTDALMR